MYKKLLMVAACFAGFTGLAQADSLLLPVYAPAYQAGHFMPVARVFLGYDQFGRPIYGHRHLPRRVIGYDRFGRPVYGIIYNNEPLLPAFAIFNSIVRPYDTGWNWRHRHWDRGEHLGWDRGEHRGWDRGEHRGWDRGEHRGWDHREHGDRHD